MRISYIEFRKKLDEFYSQNSRDSVTQQLVDLTDLFQKISAVYTFARPRENTSLKNPVIFQIIESALHYGVCVQIRRLADGSQHNEISLIKLVHEIRSNCGSWSRSDFVTWDGLPYDASSPTLAHENEVSRITSEWPRDGTGAGYLPIGRHVDIDRRHAIFDLLSSASVESRSEADVWTTNLANYLENTLEVNGNDVIPFANQYLAHRTRFPPGREPKFNISLEKIESSIIGLWRCYNVLNSIFYNTFMSSDIIVPLGSFNNLHLAIASQNDVSGLQDAYAKAKERMETAINTNLCEWQTKLASK